MSAIGLPNFWRIKVRNEAGVTIDVTDAITVDARYVKIGSDGELSFDTVTREIYGLGTDDVNNNAYHTGANIDNDTNKWMGADLLFTVIFPSGTSGQVVFWMEISTDDGTTWPGDGQGILLKSVPNTPSTTIRRNKRI